MSIYLMEAPFAVFASTEGLHNGEQYAQLNQYSLREESEDNRCNGAYLTPEAWAAMKRTGELATDFNFDESDSQVDYFFVNFYLHLSIGKWNKPFKKI